MKKLVAISLTIIIIGILLIGVADLPEFGKEKALFQNEVAKKYIQEGEAETGALNIVTGIILDYRAFDTFVEATVLFTGAMCVMLVLKKE